MPELPEVETVRRGLTHLVKGKTIAQVVVSWPKIIERPEVETFALALIGETIQKIERRGKFLLFRLTHWTLISHLRMEGKYEFFDQSVPADKHTHVIFQFTDGSELHYRDVRKFGRMSLLKNEEVANYGGLKKLGPEPVLPDFSLSDFAQGLKKSHKMIKPLLLDQKLVTGLGNIYVDEALWQAKIHPEQGANTLRPEEVQVLHDAIISVLARAVKAGGTTIRTYANALGEAGSFQVELHAYGQTDQPCPRCGTPIKKIKVAQRGTHFCPTCQVLREG
jgi:formamidopyrimidine-DNA glycosylase